jgi:hypothetical protein
MDAAEPRLAAIALRFLVDVTPLWSKQKLKCLGAIESI